MTLKSISDKLLVLNYLSSSFTPFSFFTRYRFCLNSQFFCGSAWLAWQWCVWPMTSL